MRARTNMQAAKTFGTLLGVLFVLPALVGIACVALFLKFTDCAASEPRLDQANVSSSRADTKQEEMK